MAAEFSGLCHHPGPVSLRPANREPSRLAIADAQECAVTAISISTNLFAVGIGMRFCKLLVNAQIESFRLIPGTSSQHWRSVAHGHWSPVDERDTLRLPLSTAASCRRLKRNRCY
jgi:hypothetical protein